jgi:orotidine-5'-phosphate decarboxylase
VIPYLDRLKARIGRLGPFCVGLDPHPSLLAAWGLPASAAGAERFARSAVEALADQTACFKPQSAFFELWGAAGVQALELVIADAQAAGALVIVDAKRGDIGSTMAAYADAYLGGGPLSGDAVTVSPYLGVGALAPAFERAEACGRGVYVLARTSNPEGGAIQLAAVSGGGTVSQSVVDAAAARNEASGLGAVGLVVGGARAGGGTDLSRFSGSLLVPGVGAQGGSMAVLSQLLGPTPAVVLPTVSRAVLEAGPDPKALRAAAVRFTEEAQAAL